MSNDSDLLKVSDHQEIGEHAAGIGARAAVHGDRATYDEADAVMNRERAAIRRKGGDPDGLKKLQGELRNVGCRRLG